MTSKVTKQSAGTEHTPGPWEQDGLTIRCSRGIIARLPVPQAGGVFDVQANAKLIASAPRLRDDREGLLKALREIDNTLSGTLPATKEVKAIARKAIADAERES